MPIMNKTRNLAIAKKTRLCRTVASKCLGLMFSGKDDDLGLIFCFDKAQVIPIHMLFVFYSIDLIYLDKARKIVEIKRNLKPFSFYVPKSKASYLIETVSGRAGTSRIGDIISFQ